MCTLGKKKKMKRCLDGNTYTTSNDTEEHFIRQIFDDLNVSVCGKSVVITPKSDTVERR